MTGLARAALLAAIRLYKRHLSPRKGFSCAYRRHTGRCSCSTLGYRAISRYGAWRGLGVLQLRLEQCGIKGERPVPRAFGRLQSQAGFIDGDCDCSGCDLPSCELPSCNTTACDVGCDVLGNLLDWPDDCDGCGNRSWRRRERPVRERGVAQAPIPTWEPGPDETRGRDFQPPPSASPVDPLRDLSPDASTETDVDPWTALRPSRT